MRSILIISLCFVFAGCQRDGKLCLRKAGEPGSQTVELEPFTQLIAQDNIEFIIVPSNEHKMVIEAGANIIPTIQYGLSGDSLIVENKSACKWYRRYSKSQVKIFLYMNELTSVKMYHGGSVSSDDTLRGNKLELQAFDSGGSFDLLVNVDTLSTGLHTGPTDATITGICETAYCYSASDGFIDCRNLRAKSCFVNHSGQNDFYIWCTNYAGLQILREGNIYLKGNPPIVEGTFTGEGQLIHF